METTTNTIALADQLKAKVESLIVASSHNAKLQADYDELQAKYRELSEANSKLVGVISDITAMIDQRQVTRQDIVCDTSGITPEFKGLYVICYKLWLSTLSHSDRAAMSKDTASLNYTIQRTGDFYDAFNVLPYNERKTFYMRVIWR